jgi:uncharacterized protein YkwD
MKRILLLLLPVIVLTSFVPDNPSVKIDKDRAKEAYVYLNQIRLAPEQYYDKFPFLKGLPIKRTALVWNDTLAKAAEQKAFDMADRNYFAHVDPGGYGMNYYINAAGYTLIPDFMTNNSDNNFESCYMGYTFNLDDSEYKTEGIKAINTLIIDKGVPSLGHRKHLLGLEVWNASLYDIGIGFAVIKTENNGFNNGRDMYKIYVSLLIAKHS